MSVLASTWAWQQQIPPNAKLVLVALADHAHDDGTHAWPSKALLARKTGYSERQIQRVLAELVNTGIIRMTRMSTRTRPNEYALNIQTDFVLARGEFIASGCDPDLRLEIIERDGQVCTLCEQSGDEIAGWDGAPWEVDRINPIGHYEWDNVRLSCRTCNRRRGRVTGQDVHPLAGQDVHPGATSDPKSRDEMSTEPSVEPSGESSTTPAPAGAETVELTAGDLVARWYDGARDREGETGERPFPTIEKRMKGQAKNMAKDLSTEEDWSRALDAAYAAGCQGLWDLAQGVPVQRVSQFMPAKIAEEKAIYGRGHEERLARQRERDQKILADRAEKADGEGS